MQSDRKSLNTLTLGKKAIVSELTATGSERRRMLDLGLVHGAPVEAIHVSPMGDPIAYSIMGAVIALRRDDAKKVIIQELS